MGANPQDSKRSSRDAIPIEKMHGLCAAVAVNRWQPFAKRLVGDDIDVLVAPREPSCDGIHAEPAVAVIDDQGFLTGQLLFRADRTDGLLGDTAGIGHQRIVSDGVNGRPNVQIYEIS